MNRVRKLGFISGVVAMGLALNRYGMKSGWKLSVILSALKLFVHPAIVYVLAFGLGFGLPLLVLPFLTEATRKFVLQKMMVHQRLLARVAGVLLIGIGTIGFVKDWSMIRSKMSPSKWSKSI